MMIDFALKSQALAARWASLGFVGRPRTDLLNPSPSWRPTRIADRRSPRNCNVRIADRPTCLRNLAAACNGLHISHYSLDTLNGK
jgi:hypothetical protein